MDKVFTDRTPRCDKDNENRWLTSNVVKAGDVGEWDSEVANRCPWIVVGGGGGGGGRDE